MRRTVRGGGRVVPMLAVEDCAIFAVSESVTAHLDASETLVLRLRGGYHGVGGCGVYVCGGLRQLSLLIALCARDEAGHDHGHDGR